MAGLLEFSVLARPSRQLLQRKSAALSSRRHPRRNGQKLPKK
jgi:hypothetical protein